MNEILVNSAIRSWKTTTAALLAAGGALAVAIGAQIDNDPETTANWGVVVPLVISTLIGLFARDNDKRSETAGAK